MRVEVAARHLQVHAQPAALGLGDERQVVDLEAQFVEAADVLGDPVLLVGADGGLGGHLPPEGPVAGGDVLSRGRGRRGRVRCPLRGEVGHAPGHVLHHQLDVVLTLPVGQRGVQAGGLGVHHGHLDRAGVVAVEDVGQRAVAPVAAEQVELHQEAGQGVEHLVAPLPEAPAGEQLPVREGVLDVGGDQRRRSLLVGVEPGSLDQADRPHRRRSQVLQPAEHGVLVAAQVPAAAPSPRRCRRRSRRTAPRGGRSPWASRGGGVVPVGHGKVPGEVEQVGMAARAPISFGVAHGVHCGRARRLGAAGSRPPGPSRTGRDLVRSIAAMSAPLCLFPPPRRAHLPARDRCRALATLTERSAAWAALPSTTASPTCDRSSPEHLSPPPRAWWPTPAPPRASAARRRVRSGWPPSCPMLRTMRLLLDTLEGIRRHGRVPLPESAVAGAPRRPGDAPGGPGGRLRPGDLPRGRPPTYGWTRRWPGRTSTANLGAFYTKGVTPPAGVSLVLGAGNVAAIAPLDVVHKMFVEGTTVAAQVQPGERVHGAARRAGLRRPHRRRVRARRCTAAGPTTATTWCRHPAVSQVHLTGSAATYDAVVWGPGQAAAAARRPGHPSSTSRSPVNWATSSPVIVVPGQWSERALRLRAEDVATQITQNGGFNCNAARVVVLPSAGRSGASSSTTCAGCCASLPPRPCLLPGGGGRPTTATWPPTTVSRPSGNARPGVLPPALLLGPRPGRAITWPSARSA